MDATQWFTLILCLVFPLLANWAHQKKYLPAWFSPIIASYAIGILIANSGFWPVNAELKGFIEGVAGLGMLVGLPLLLFSVRLKGTLGLARKMLLAFFFCGLAGVFSTAVVSYFWADSIPDTWILAGMLSGMYTGGTPNVQAIGTALSADTNYLVLIQAADILLGGAYLLALVTFLPGLYAKIFPKFEDQNAELATDSSVSVDITQVEVEQGRPLWLRLLIQLAAGIFVTALSLGITWLLTGAIENFTIVILLITSLGLGATFLPGLQRLGNTYPLGEYFILVFCVAIGLLANFSQLASEGMDLLLFCTLSIFPTVFLHLLLCYWARIDRDTVILSSVAGLYGPVFVAQISTVLGNRRLLAPGLAVSLLGFGVGNYLGISVAYALKWLIGA